MMTKKFSLRPAGFALLPALMLITVMAGDASASLDRFPRPEFHGGYQIPDNNFGSARAAFLYYMDVFALFAALCAACWVVFKKRSRKGVLALMLASIAYFGFYKSGCICSIGAIQNVSAGIFTGYAIPITVFLIFILPLIFALFFGRVFCSAVCPMGAVQDLVAVKPKKIPVRIDAPLRIIPHIYLGAAILFAATGAGFPVCKLDPFAGIFRLSAPTPLLAWGVAVLVTGIFVARPYCRYMCPYGVILGWASLISKHRVRISPGTCINCRLCENVCPVDAINQPEAEPSGEERKHSVKRLKIYFALIPVWIAAFAVCGWFLADAAAELHPNVKLLRIVELEESGAVMTKSLESEALRIDADIMAELRRAAGAARTGFRWGLTLLGIYLGIVIGGYLIRQSMYRKQDGYGTDPVSCVECGRCYGYCPQHKADKEKPKWVRDDKSC
ncbi:MAG: 4Fe-4S binding protein [Chitinispirillia bacterium]|nr:4Fe-4S binding protein [Chitinispirillia bacterium]MCL2241870.1 4Fe-4S binding protein [Chitinispirillia bacterium]